MHIDVYVRAGQNMCIILNMNQQKQQATIALCGGNSPNII